MERTSLGESPEVRGLFSAMSREGLNFKKTRMEEIVAHIDELLLSFNQIEQKLGNLREQAGGERTPILDEDTKAVRETKIVVESAKDTIRDTAGKAATLSRSELVSTLQAAHIPGMLEKMQSVLHDTELRLRRSAHKAAATYNELHSTNIHLVNVGRVICGKPRIRLSPIESKEFLRSARASFLDLADTFERFGGVTAELRAKIPNWEKAVQRGSVRDRIQELRRESAPGKERQAMEVEI